ncbi:MAG: hypothetical protein ACRD2I_24405 [Vicinamibacterales bacterium]
MGSHPLNLAVRLFLELTGLLRFTVLHDLLSYDRARGLIAQ